jgi:tRNA dimethylallyltransferase
MPPAQLQEAPLIAVVGPTGSGKTNWALALATRFDGEIIGADSRQVYRGLNIGTAKPTAAQRDAVPHHCIDHVDPRERYHLGRFLREARAAISAIRARGRQPILAGGTGQYVWALLEGWDVPEVAPDPAFRAVLEQRAADQGSEVLHAQLRQSDPAAAAAILPTNTRRLIRALEVQRATGRPISAWWAVRDPIPAAIIAPTIDPGVLDIRIDERVHAMFADGLIDETQALLQAGLPADAPGLGSIGYRQVVAHLARTPIDATGRETAIADTQQATRRLARRQRAWFRAADPRIHWAATLDTALAELPVAPGLPTIPS